MIGFRYQTSNFPGVSNNENSVAISELRNMNVLGNTNMFGKPTSNFGEYYGAAIAELGSDRKESISNVRTRSYLIEQYDTHQDSVAGVSLDEEMANLVRYNYTYQGAARIFTTVQSMLDTLMNL